ncbi:MAG TPA: hypothetical protein EYQ00_01460 [Dehalococcoidia bacterium]|nr:hypothetical protein [Dehalococcoidia bacterium]
MSISLIGFIIQKVKTAGVFAGLGIALLVFLSGCSLINDSSIVSQEQVDSINKESAGPGIRPLEILSITEELSGDGYPAFISVDEQYRVILGTPDLAIGTQRLSFLIYGPDGPMDLPHLDVRIMAVKDYGQYGEGDVVRMKYLSGSAASEMGIYVGSLTLEQSGDYLMQIAVPTRASSDPREIAISLVAREDPAAITTNMKAPLSKNLTLNDKPITELTTGLNPNVGLYRETVADAVKKQRPIVLIFASPGFCVSPMCGSQVEIISALFEVYGEETAFIHIDTYADPHKAMENPDIAQRNPILADWGIVSDQVVYLINRDGLIFARFEGFSPYAELEASIQTLITN